MTPLVAPPLQMPPTPEMTAKLAHVRWCVIATYVCAAARFVVDERIGALNDLFGGLVGTFLLKEDPHLAACYRCLLDSPLAAFGDGGLGCLVPYFLISGLNGIFGVLRAYELLYDEGSLLPCLGNQPHNKHRSDAHFVVGLACTRTIWLLVSAIAQLVGMVFSWKVYKLMQIQIFGGIYAHPDEAAERGSAEAVGRDDAEPHSPPLEGSAPAAVGTEAQTEGSARSQNATATPQPSQRQQARQQRRAERQAQAKRRAATSFQPFQGQGHRLTPPTPAVESLAVSASAADTSMANPQGPRITSEAGVSATNPVAVSHTQRAMHDHGVTETASAEPPLAISEEQLLIRGCGAPANSAATCSTEHPFADQSVAPPASAVASTADPTPVVSSTSDTDVTMAPASAAPLGECQIADSAAASDDPPLQTCGGSADHVPAGGPPEEEASAQRNA